MSKIVDFFKKIPEAYYTWKKRNENLSSFLVEANNTREKLSHIDNVVTNLNKDMQHVKTKIQNLENQVEQVNGRLETINKGTMMELFDTLHNWRINLVILKKWASPSEKREVEEVYHVYHDELHGNGQGQRYYNEIMALPESQAELDALKRSEQL